MDGTYDKLLIDLYQIDLGQCCLQLNLTNQP